MTLVWETPLQGHTLKLVMIALADNASDQGVCWPSIKHLARKCDLSRQAVMDQIEKLVSIGVLEVTKATGVNNRYMINVRGLIQARGVVDDFDEAHTVDVPDQSTALTSPPNNQSTALTTTGQPSLPLGVNGVDYHQSTALTLTISKPPVQPPVQPPDGVKVETWGEWMSYRKRIGRVKDWEALFHKQREWMDAQPIDDRDEIINQSIRNGWQGLFPLKSPAKASVNGGRDSSNQSGMDKLIHQKELERVMDRMRLIANGYSGHQDWRQPDREEYRRLKSRREELKRILGVMI